MENTMSLLTVVGRLFALVTSFMEMWMALL